MNKYNKEYYIPFVEMNENKLFVGMDKKTVMRTGYQKLNLVDGPMMFHNNYKEDDQKEGIKKTIPDILLKTNQLIIPKTFMKFLRNFDIQGIELFPAIYIDDDDKWHANLWVVHCYEGVNCLDIENSEIDFDPDYWEEGDELLVKTSYLSEKILSNIKEDNRLIFKIPNVSEPHLYCHQRVVDFIREMKYTGVQFIKVADFEEGMQNHEGFDGVTTY